SSCSEVPWLSGHRAARRHRGLVGPDRSRPTGRVIWPDVTGGTAYMDQFPSPAMRRGGRPRESSSWDDRPLETVEGEEDLFYPESAKRTTGNGAGKRDDATRSLEPGSTREAPGDRRPRVDAESRGER